MKLCSYCQASGPLDFLKEPLFYNRNILINGESFYDKHWQERGVMFVNDLVMDNGEFLTWEHFKHKYSIVNNNFLRFYSILNSIPDHWKNSIRQNGLRMDRVDCSCLKTLTAVLKPNKSVYSHLIREMMVIPEITKQKWCDYLDIELSEEEWSDIFMAPFKATSETKLIVFQFRLFHRIIGTNYSLYRFRIKASSRCTFCNLEPETIEHVFWCCFEVYNFWLALGTWLSNHSCKVSIYIWSVFLGFPSDDRLGNTIVLCAKEYIYRCRLAGTVPNLPAMLRVFSQRLDIEKINKSHDYVSKKWGNLYNCL